MLRYSATIFLSAFLLFQIQPVIAKQILPWFGGAASVWIVCLLFFQVALLAGYAPGERVTVHAFRRDELMSFNVELQAVLPDTCVLSLLDEVDDAVRARRVAWLGGT